MAGPVIRALRNETQRWIAWLLLELALLIEWPARRTAVAIYGVVERMFTSSSNLHVQRTVAQAMVSSSLALGELHRCEDAMAVCDRLVTLFGQSPDSELRTRVAWAMVNKGYFLQQLGRDREAVAEYEEVHRRFAQSPEATAAYVTGRRNMRIALSRLGRASEAEAIGRQLAMLPGASAHQQSGSMGARMMATAVAVATTCLLDLGISIVVYRAIPRGHPGWLVFPLLYIDHQEHSQVMAGKPGRFLLVAFAGILGMLIVRYTAGLPLWARIAVGVGFGGALANAIEYGVVGSVTDFIGVRTTGIWSSGDICLVLGMLTIAAAGIARPETLAPGAKRRGLLLVVLGFAIVATVLSGSFVWMTWAALVYAVGFIGALAAFALSVTRRRAIGPLR